MVVGALPQTLHGAPRPVTRAGGKPPDPAHFRRVSEMKFRIVCYFLQVECSAQVARWLGLCPKPRQGLRGPAPAPGRSPGPIPFPTFVGKEVMVLNLSKNKSVSGWIIRLVGGFPQTPFAARSGAGVGRRSPISRAIRPGTLFCMARFAGLGKPAGQIQTAALRKRVRMGTVRGCLAENAGG